MSAINRLFVYGTLKRGEPNHHWFSKTKEGISRFLSEAETIEKYPLIIATKYNIPFLLHKPGEGYNVQGEVYEVCDLTLKQLDILEEHPNFYVREIEPIFIYNDERCVEAWVYFLKSFKPDLLNYERFQSYTSEGGHGLKYMDRYQRNKHYDHKSEVFFKTNNDESTIDDL